MPARVLLDDAEEDGLYFEVDGRYPLITNIDFVDD